MPHTCILFDFFLFLVMDSKLVTFPNTLGLQLLVLDSVLRMGCSCPTFLSQRPKFEDCHLHFGFTFEVNIPAHRLTLWTDPRIMF